MVSDNLVKWTDNAGHELRHIVDGGLGWVSQRGFAEAFGVTVQRAEQALGETAEGYLAAGLSSEATIKYHLIVASEDGRTVTRSVKHYSDRVVLAAAFRVGSPQAVAYQMWATTVLAEFIRTGSVVDEQRLAVDPEAREKLAGTLARASINSVRGTILSALSKIGDYRAYSAAEVSVICARVTNAFLVSASGLTAAELVRYRCNAGRENCGATNWRGDSLAVSDVQVGTSFLSENQIEAYLALLNMCVVVANLIREGVVDDSVAAWESFITDRLGGFSVPRAAVSPVTSKAAKQFARREFSRFSAALPAPVPL